MNALHLAAGKNHVDVVRALVEEFGMSVTCRSMVTTVIV